MGQAAIDIAELLDVVQVGVPVYYVAPPLLLRSHPDQPRSRLFGLPRQELVSA